ncbi:MAG: 4-hydroxy-3-polyprenylbenzoate decarboxylase [Francisellaceae bacterium]|jgi:4-hydroxy-3-polyprenylbenzoate decarboxylase
MKFNQSTQIRKLAIGITGASGIVYGVRLLEILRELNIESHLIISKAGELTREYETNISSKELKSKATIVHSNSDLAASVSSGSYPIDGMIIAPCSMKTLAEIANGTTTGLISRTADVMLKERRRLVLLARETPLTSIHLNNMLAVTNAGAIVMPPVPAFYTKPQSLDDIVNYTAIRALDLFGVEIVDSKRWKASK